MSNLYHPFISFDRNLANGAGMTDCELCGIAGLCGDDCPSLGCDDCSLVEDFYKREEAQRLCNIERRIDEEQEAK